MACEHELNINFSLEENENLSPLFELEQNSGFNPVFKIDAAPYKTSQLINDSFIEEINGSELIDVNTVNFSTTIKSKTFVFEQGIATDAWQIKHDLDKFPSVTLVDSAGTQFQGRVEYIDENNCIVYMNGATKGKAYLN